MISSMNQNTTPKNQDHLPKILCLHGGGASAAIFRFQTRKIQYALRAHFRFFFIDGPIESEPGPGILPYFAGMAPYHRWVSYKNDEAEIKEEAENVLETIMEEVEREGPFVGVIGFSQGTRIVAGLLLREQFLNSGNDGSACGFRFGVLAGASYPPVRIPFRHTRDSSRASGDDDTTDHNHALIHIPTIHVQGIQDFVLLQSRRLLEHYCDVQSTTLLEFEGGHHLPVSLEDNKKLADMILDVWHRQGKGEQEVRTLNNGTTEPGF